MSFRDWLDCPECEDGGDPTFTEVIDAQKRVIKCNDCGHEEFVKIMRNETSRRKTVRDVFVSEYGSGFNVFNTPLDHEDKKFLVGLLADTDPAELTKTSIENRYSLRVHFMEKADSLVTYCDSRRFVVFVVWFDEFVVSKEVNEQCLACDTVGGYKLDGTEGQTHSEDNYRREVVFCEGCLGSLSNRLKDGEFTASVVSNHI